MHNSILVNFSPQTAKNGTGLSTDLTRLRCEVTFHCSFVDDEVPIIGVGAQSTVGGTTFLPENIINKMSEFYMILARKIITIPEFLLYLPEKLTKFPNFT